MSIYQKPVSKDSLHAYMDVIPPCDICGSPAQYDARLSGVFTWAYVCHTHYEQFGTGLGEGLGQELVLRSKKMIPDQNKGLEDLQRIATLNGILRAAVFLHENGEKAAAEMVTELAVSTFPKDLASLTNKANSQGDSNE